MSPSVNSLTSLNNAQEKAGSNLDCRMTLSDPRKPLVDRIACTLADFDGRRLAECPREARETYKRRAETLLALFYEHQGRELHDWHERHK